MTKTSITRKGDGVIGRIGVLRTVIFISLLMSSCGANEGILKSGKDTSIPTNSTPTRSTVEADIEEMRTANFTSIYLLRRKDGGEIDAEDRGVIKLNTDGVNRRIGSDNGRAFVIGSNYPIPADKLFALYDRFAVENYSPPENTIVNGNANAK